ncbi:unnamed protein product, partial [Allacma fusca]
LEEEVLLAKQRYSDGDVSVIPQRAPVNPKRELAERMGTWVPNNTVITWV